VHADDPDLGPSGHVTYSFPEHVQRVYGDVFRVDSESGAIYLRSALDFEKSARYRLVVAAADHGTSPSLPATAKVKKTHSIPFPIILTGRIWRGI